MRAIVWFLLLFAVAVVAATTFGTNDGLVSIYWGSWRIDTSLNLFLLALIGTCFAIVTAIQAIGSFTGLPRRARAWRVARRDRTAQAVLREALAQYFGGRYSRAQSAAQRALAIQADTPELGQDNEFTVLGHLLAAGSAHRMQDRATRDEELERALQLARGSAAARPAEEGARLLAAEWAIDDRDAPRALALLADLPPGVARRTHALRLKLQAARLGQHPQEALKTARMLAKHQGFSKEAALGLLRSLALESLDAARDIDQLRRIWLQFDTADRRDAVVAAGASTRAAALGSPEEGRVWIKPFWDHLDDLGADDRAILCEALVTVLAGIGPEWLPKLEAAAQSFPREGAVAYAVGCALAERQLWGKARPLLETAATDAALTPAARRHALLRLAQLAQEQGDAEQAARCYEAAARLE